MLLAAVIATVIVMFFTVDIGNITIGGRSLKSLAEKQGTKFLEREMTIDRIVAYVTPGKFAFEGVTIKGPYPNARPFFEAKRIVVNVPWWTLFNKQLHIDVTLSGWRMVVQQWPDGQAHLPKLTPKGPGSPNPPWYKIRGLAVYANDGEFVYDDGVTPWSVIGPNLNFSIVRADNLSTYVGVAEFQRGTVKVQQFEPMSADFTRPKSMTLTINSPSSSRTSMRLEGLMSRCTSPCLSAAMSAAATWLAMSSATIASSGPSRFTRASTVSPSMNSIA